MTSTVAVAHKTPVANNRLSETHAQKRFPPLSPNHLTGPQATYAYPDLSDITPTPPQIQIISPAPW